ncbi:hypothetical protein KFU94_07820 [Chloroflexi bacterium TSY]|nr:hypothetical protein [Chloroflexi bacterium TSY]
MMKDCWAVFHFWDKNASHAVDGCDCHFLVELHSTDWPGSREALTNGDPISMPESGHDVTDFCG